MAFGDGDNDTDMLEFAHIGVAMGNASKKAIDAADYTTTDIDNDGIANALRHYHLL
ncbi:MAG: HAD hydrolase family protein [Lachnospiraceae bacterium]|jgi:hydroxymethylpyrimidine pyrophosphatase-like HAD family hydrolase|nr:HAD hydrolase family protein [Lachnospiraceae bacterium]